MVKCKKVIMALVVLTGSSAFAAANSSQELKTSILGIEDATVPEISGGMHSQGACMKLMKTLTVEQKASLKELHYKFQQTQADNQAAMKKAVLVFGHTLGDKNSVRADGDAAKAAMVAAIDGKVQAKLTLALDSIYGVLLPEQRENAVMCGVSMHKKMNDRKVGHGSDSEEIIEPNSKL